MYRSAGNGNRDLLEKRFGLIFVGYGSNYSLLTGQNHPEPSGHFAIRSVGRVGRFRLVLGDDPAILFAIRCAEGRTKPGCF